MAVTVPSWDIVPYNLQQQIANINTLMTNATQALNGALVNTLQMQYFNAQLALVLALLGTGALSPATIISTMTYITPNSDSVAASGATGPLAGASEGGLI